MRSGPPIYIIDGFSYEGGGGGGGDGQELGGSGPKGETLGQEVPQPITKPVPEKPAPIQPATKQQDTFKVDDAKDPPKTDPAPPVQKKPHVKVADKDQKAQDNVVRVGRRKNQEGGDGLFDFGKGMGRGKAGSGPGIGIGVGPGSGPGSGFGFGSYVGLLRTRIWSEWTQTSLYGAGKECVVGLTIQKSGTVTNIKVEKSSKDPFFDNVARRAVRNSSPLPPLPASFPNSSQRFRIKFVLAE